MLSKRSKLILDSVHPQGRTPIGGPVPMPIDILLSILSSRL